MSTEPECPLAIDVVIVNYCTGSFVIACLESLELARCQAPTMRVIVVDNDSPDQSANLIEATIGARGWDWAVLLRSNVNGGFGAGNNIGIDWALDRPVRADLIWLLNPDTVARPAAGLELARFMAAHPRAGIAGSALLEGDGRPWPFAFRFPTILGEIERGAQLGIISRLLRNQAILRPMGDRPEPVDWVSGASFVIRRELLESGLRFDETFFLYYEETDFCLQAHHAGWECWYVPDSVILHVAGQSTGVTGRQIKLRRLPGYWFKSRRHYFLKNHGRSYGILADLGWMGAHLIARVKHWLLGSPDTYPPRLLADFLRHSTFVPRRLPRPRRDASLG